MPFPIQMVVAGSINNIMWIIYTSLTARWLMFTPNLVTLSAGLFQVVLYFFVYNPKTHPYKTDEQRSTATTEEDESEQDDNEVSPSPPLNEDEGGCDVESGEYMTIHTPRAAQVAPEMLRTPPGYTYLNMTAILAISRVFASCTSLFMLLSPAPMVYKIHKDQHSGVLSIVPLVAVLVNSHMWMMYGYLDDNYFPVFATFLAGDVFLCFFIVVFYRYAVNRRKAHFVFAVAGVAMAAMTLYCVLAGFGYTGQTHEGVANTAGALSAITGTIMYGSPLEKIFHVFKYKSAAFIPIHLICAGAINNTAWILFAMLTGKYIILVPSFFALAGNLFQVVLYFFVFNPKTHPLMLDKPKDATIEETQTDSAQLEVVVAQSPSMGENTCGNFQALVSPVVCHEKHLQNSI